jgi:hypothetical protein
MKNIARILAGVLLAGLLTAPTRSDALLTSYVNLDGHTLVSDGTGYWLWSIDSTTTSTVDLFPVVDPSFNKTYQNQSDFASQIGIQVSAYAPIQTVWRMATLADLNSLYLAAGDGTTGSTTNIVAAFQNSGNLGFGLMNIRLDTPSTYNPASDYHVIAYLDEFGTFSTSDLNSPYSVQETGYSYSDTTTTDYNYYLPIGALYYASAVPEPGTYILFAIALSVVVGLRMKQRWLLRASSATN